MMELNKEWEEDIANLLSTMSVFAEYMTEKKLWGEFSIWVVEKKPQWLSDMLKWCFNAPIQSSGGNET